MGVVSHSPGPMSRRGLAYVNEIEDTYTLRASDGVRPGDARPWREAMSESDFQLLFWVAVVVVVILGIMYYQAKVDTRAYWSK